MSRWSPPLGTRAEHEAAARCNALEIERMNANLALASALNALRALEAAIKDYLSSTGTLAHTVLDGETPLTQEHYKLAIALEQVDAMFRKPL